ncbi:uncharacterized protein RCC_05618 [Ramularia collo-cygni]|uniref:Glycine zipper 2TM domain-containing protein n=1 Tax=Ramularia collo-cygni TaxID=112498 RepID=A0A2D3VGE8_9PEZI|nr:uncharacterized protein RCC_05618 [Ramularia collo-cygni]CZT19763.1 uncharacterized protein RCC_05618 [Ramularia collo-cygni]
MSREMFSPPPGQGRPPASGYEDRRDRRSQQRFDPPRASEYEDYDAPRTAYQDDRPYAPADPRPHSFNQVTPYDDRAEPEWPEDQRVYTHRVPPPPSDYELGRKPYPPTGGRIPNHRYDDRTHNDRRPHNDRYSDYSYSDDRSYDDGPYDNRPCDDRFYDDRYNDRSYDDRSYDDRSYDDRSYESRDRERETRPRRERPAEEELKEKALGYPSDPKKGGRDILGGSEGERGMAAKLIGGAGGAFLGQTFGRGHTLETIAGAAVGAIAAAAIEKQIEKRKEEKVIVRRGRDGYAATPAGPFPQPGRDMRDVRETGRDEAPQGLKERLRSLSKKGLSSLSGRRPTEERRRRSDSYNSVDSRRRERSR